MTQPRGKPATLPMDLVSGIPWVAALAVSAMGAQGMLWTAAIAQFPPISETGPWFALLWAHLAAFMGIVIHGILAIPTVDWPLPKAHEGGPVRSLARKLGRRLLPHAWSTTAVRAVKRRRADDDTAFRRLLVLPQQVTVQVMIWGSLAACVTVVALGAHGDWAHTTSVYLLLLWLMGLVPVALLSGAVVRTAVVPVLGARGKGLADDSTDASPRFAVRWAGSLGLLLTVGTLVPLLAAHLWMVEYHRDQRLHIAAEIGERVARTAQGGDSVALGKLLAEHPEAAVRMGRRTYGAFPLAGHVHEGPLDIDGDRSPDGMVVRFPNGAVFVGLPATSGLSLIPALGIAVLFAGTGLYVAFRTARDLDADIAAATRYIDGVLSPQDADSPSHRFRIREIGDLIRASDRLVHRMAETNIARFVATEKMREAEKIKSQFLANMSHDLRSPLNAILGFSELLLSGIDGELPPEDRQMVQQINESGRRLLAQIDDILDMAKVESGRMQLSPEPTPPITLVSRAASTVRKEAEDVEFRTQAAPGMPPVHADPYRTVQAIANVLRFAVAHDPDRPVSVTLRPFEEAGERFVVVRIHAPGVALSSEDLRLARRGFLKVAGQHGLGLGLPLATALLELQGGRLDVEDTGDGVVFSIYLPAPRVARRLILGETPAQGLVAGTPSGAA